MEKLTNFVALKESKKPVAMTAGSALGTAIDGRGFSRAVYVIHSGSSVAGNGTVDMCVLESATSTGTYTEVTSGSIAQITAGSTGNATVSTVDFSINNTKPFTKAKVTVGTATVDVGVMVLLYNGTHVEPVTQDVTVVSPS